jgi:uncharacterized protein (TIGR02246 family)
LGDIVEAGTPDDAVNAVVIQRLDGIKNRDPHTIRSLFSDEYTKFDDWPPVTRQDIVVALRNEFNAYHALTNYEYEVRDCRVTVFDDVALATFYLHYTGSMRGKRFAVTSRVTVVLRTEEGAWKVIHEHYSRFPRRRRRLFTVC